jgi:hypothetical protein
MQKRNLTKLAAKPDLISGVYNYCDRWCERCQFTSRCLVYVTENEDENVLPESRDSNNQAFWNKLDSMLHDAREMLITWSEEVGIDLDQINDEGTTQKQKRQFDVAEHPLAEAGKEYATAVTEWFRGQSEIFSATAFNADLSALEQSEDIQHASEVIQWYQYQIAVKTMRALSSRDRDQDPEEGMPEEAHNQKDSDGSAKVALMAIDRSISAWHLLQNRFSDRVELIMPLILQLDRLRRLIEKEFPSARHFMRPGFDEIMGLAH